MKPVIRSLFFILFLVCIPSLRANELYFRHYTNKDGLSHNTVYSSVQDKKGYMWFGTEDGLNRFDGYSFKVYRYNSYQKNSLPGNDVARLYVDSEGTLWVMTNRTTSFYDEKSDSFIPFQLDPASDTVEYFSNVTEDHKQQLWFIRNDRIICYSLTGHTYKRYNAESYFRPWFVTSTASGNPIFADNHAVYRYRPETDDFERTPIITEEEKTDRTNISAICEIPELGILVGTTKAGLKLLPFHSNEITQLLPDVQVRCITEFNQHTYWIGTESGIFIYNIINRTINNLTKSLTNEYTLADNAVYSITQDHEGGMWVGTFFGGISYLPNETMKFNRFIGGKTHAGLLGNAIREICPDMYGNLWIGTEDNGINKYDPQTGAFTNYSLKNHTHPLSATNIHGLLADGSRLWVGTYNRGIDVLDIPSGRIIRRYTRENTNNQLGDNFILCFYRTRSNQLLVGTGSGMFVLNEENETFSRWHNIYPLIRQIYEDIDDNIWVSSSNGVFRYNPHEDKLYSYYSDPYSAHTIGSNNTTSIFEDSKGRIWVTTMNGFSLYNDKTDSFNRITAEDGLPSNIVYRILEDKDHYFWIATANGLVKFHPESYNMRIFSYRDGLHESQFNYSSSYVSPSGTMYMGTINGMISFNPRNFKDDGFIPPIHISLGNLPGTDPVRYDQIKETMQQSGTLELPYDKATFILRYGAISYTSPEAIQYAYMLEGIDNDWIYMNQNREVTFANLSPGKYLFKVRSTNSSGIWQNNEQLLHIIIVPPFWLTSLALLIYGVILIILTILFYYYKKSQFEKKHRINREIFESKKEKELYDAKIQFFTFITHEIRTPLTLIKAPLEKILNSGDGNAKTKENLQVIGKNTQRLLDLSNQLLDFRKTESKGFKLSFVQTDIVLWFDTLLTRFAPSLEKGDKNITIEKPAEAFHAYLDRDAFTKIVGNMITNAIKYSDKKITIRLSAPDEETKNFAVSVLNDGPLIPAEDKEKIFTPFYRVKENENIQGSGIGLSLAHSLAEFHNGELTYGYSVDGLNLFTLTLPVEQDSYYQIETISLPEESPVEIPAPEESSDKPLILIVEDQADMRHFIAQEVSAHYYVVEADNGKTALEVLEKHPVKMIISDVMMPVMDGFELCNTVKNNVHFSHIPFIILTAQHNLQSRLQGLNNGADAYIEKPFSIELLLSQIRNLFKSRDLLNRNYLEKPLESPATLAVSRMDELFLEKLNNYIETNISDENLNVEMVASEMNMSTSSLYRKVKGLSAISPVEYIKVARLKKAVLLMKDGENRINEIAFKVGFSSPAYFSTCFQKQYGKSPSEFMKG